MKHRTLSAEVEAIFKTVTVEEPKLEDKSQGSLGRMRAEIGKLDNTLLNIAASTQEIHPHSALTRWKASQRATNARVTSNIASIRKRRR